ncbi:hypothetical protein Tco_0693815 [Tanacetum coccineum]
MSTSNEQTLTDLGANERPPMLEKGNYIAWESRPMIPNPDNDQEEILEPLSKMTTGNKSQYIADVKVTSHVGHSRLMDEFDNFTTKEGESLESVYESKYVTIVCHNQTGDTVSYDVLYDSLIHFKPRAKHRKKFSTPTNNYLRTSSNTRNQAMIQDDRIDIKTKNTGYGGNGYKNAGRQNINQAFNAGTGNDESNQIIQCVLRNESTMVKANVQCYNCNEKGQYACDCQKPRVNDAKYFREQIFSRHAA